MINFNIRYLPEADSTNDYLKKLMHADEIQEGTVILADYQKSGRGRGQNRWHSLKGQNLTFSVVLNPGIQAGNFFQLTEWVSLSVIDFLLHYKIKATVKWPNDIYVGECKISGILIENTITDNEIIRCIAGIGINVNEIDFPKEIPNPISMRMINQESFDRNALLEIFLEILGKRFDQIKSDDLKSIHEEYNRALYKKGIFAQFRDKDGLFKACIKEIKHSGELILELENGVEKGYLFGEIEIVN